MKKSLLIIFLLISSLCNSQKESFKDKDITFFIKIRKVHSKEITSSMREKEKSLYNSFKDKVEQSSDTLEKIEIMPKYKAFDITSVRYFRVTPKEYIEFEIRDKNSPIFNERNFTNIWKITRDSLKMSFFSIKDFEFLDFTLTESYDEGLTSFETVKIDKKDRKEICGFDCYKVVLEGEFKIFEMYVTEEIQLNYHPVTNNLKLLNKYYPLYVRLSSKNYSNDIFTEWSFSKGLR